MYTANLKLNNKNFKGTLDFEVLINCIYELKKMGRELTFPSFFTNIATEDMQCIAVLINQSILKFREYDESEILNAYLSDDNSLKKELIKFENIFAYINELLDKCLPKVEKKESIFDDDGMDFINDWDLAHMEFIWANVLKRTDKFKDITPKNFFEQVNMYKKANNIKDEEIEEL